MITTQAAGNIGRVDFKQVGSTALLEFSLGCTTGFGERKKTSWLSCKMWGKSAEAMEQYFTVGKAIIINGDLEEETWEKDGDKRSKMVVNVKGFTFQQGGKSDSSSESKPSKQRAQSNDDAFDDENIPF